MIGPNELTVAIALIKRAPLEGHEAKAAAVTLDKLERLLETMTSPQEVTDGDDSNTAE
jgi:hypothetical protein